MFLKKLVINGFKSFCDYQEINFDKGVSAIVGPNGCGKSNIVDALKWVLGEQKTKALRLNSMTDVVFKGTEQRKGVGRAEVRLVLINDDNILPVEFNEVEIARIIYTNGDNEYYINKEKVRLKDIYELFYDTGVGKSAYSFMEQGKIDMILSNKPEDRRYIIEEAAGITKYKSRKMDALSKLERAEENIVRVQDILTEVTKQYESMKKQADKAERYKNLRDKEVDLEIEINVNRLIKQKEIKGDFDGKIKSLNDELSAVENEIAALQGDVADKMIFLNSLENEKIDSQRVIYQLESDIKLLNSKSSMMRDQLINLNNSLRLDEEKIVLINKKLEDIEYELEEADESRYEVSERIQDNIKDTERYNSNIKSIDIDIASDNGEIDRLKKEIKDLNLKIEEKRVSHREVTDELIVKIDEMLNSLDMSARDIVNIKENINGELKAVIDEMPIRRAFIDDILKTGVIPAKNDELLKMIGGLGENLSVMMRKLESIGQNMGKYMNVTDTFMTGIFSPEGVLQRKRKIESEMSEIADKIDKNQVRIEELEDSVLVREDQKDKYREIISELKVNYSTLKEKQNSIEKDIQRISAMKREHESTRDELTLKIKTHKEQVEDVREELDNIEYETKTALASKNEQEKKIKDLEFKIQDENARMSQQQVYIREINEKFITRKSDIEKLNIRMAEAETTINNIYETFYENFSINLKDYEKNDRYKTGREYSDVRTELSELRNEKGGLGSVNLLAIEECKSLEERFNLLTEQLADLANAKKDLLLVIDELNKVSQELFAVTFEKIRANYKQLFTKLFGGGYADILLTDKTNLLETGIDIIARPPSQKTDSITLLSGGQRTMAAISLMFATFLVKPSPFCLLDEIDAALDEQNVTRFTSLLKDFKDQSQFVIITHNKKTMSAANVMYGVTQESQGVSKIVSAKFIE